MCVCVFSAHLQCGQHYLLHRREIGLPEELSLLSEGQDLILVDGAHRGRDLWSHKQSVRAAQRSGSCCQRTEADPEAAADTGGVWGRPTTNLLLILSERQSPTSELLLVLSFAGKLWFCEVESRTFAMFDLRDVFPLKATSLFPVCPAFNHIST